MKLKFLTILLALILTTVISIPAGYADSEKKEKLWRVDKVFFHKAHFILKNGKDLGLTEEQVKTIISLKMDTKKDLIKKKADIEVISVDILSELFEDKVDVKNVNKLIDQKYEAKKELAKSLVASYAKLKETLTEEQLKKLKDIWMSGKQ